MEYIAQQIWLSKNNLIFDAKIVPAHRVFEKALSLDAEHYRFDTASLFVDVMASWDSRDAFAASWMILSVS